ncbi:MAG: reprolysin-like metallopeptidase, partial [Bacteroidota bacterium]
TYAGQGVEHRDEILRLSITEHGLHAMVLSPRGDVYLDPLNPGDRINHLVYYKGDFRPNRPFECATDDQELYKEIKQKLKLGSGGGSVLRTHGTQLRNYRLAMAATGEYTAYHGGTKSSALSAIVVSMNRVNGIYEKEVAVRMTLIPNDTLIIYTNGSTDPYTNNDGSTMLGENITNCNSVIGSANYDIGHVFSTGGGGVAYLGVPCTSNKAGGVTGSGSPVGDAFDVDYVAHEIGHQFGGQHTFNSVTGSCGGGNRSSGSAYEPGSGITIMAYAGICGADNLAPNSIAYFHTHSFDQIVNYITTGSGNTCPTTTATSNTPPSATPAGLAYTIPFQTPFELSATGSDANGDAITYSWEEYDLGPSGTWNAPSGNAPLFRPFPPV